MNIFTIDVGGTDIKYAMFSDDGTLHYNDKRPTYAYEGGTKLLDSIIALIGENIDSETKMIGISSAGQIDSKNGKVIYATDTIPNWTGVEIKATIEKKFHLPVYVLNDVNSVAFGEGIFGAAEGIKDYICLTYGTGVGGAIVINGHIFEGSSGSAGEFGHMRTFQTSGSQCVDAKCTCGGTGCYEAYASTTALINSIRINVGVTLNGVEIFEILVDENHPLLNDIEKEVTIWIGNIVCGLISLIYIFNPSMIVLGGGIMEQSYVIDKIRTSVYNSVMPSFRNVIIKKAGLANLAGLYGVLAVCLERWRDGERLDLS